MIKSNRPAMSAILALVGILLMTFYFMFAAVAGPKGLFRRSEVRAEAQVLHLELARLEAEVARMENLTHRLSDEFLDLDLLDQQAREILGMIRADEIVIR